MYIFNYKLFAENHFSPDQMSPSLWMINFAYLVSEENSINVITQLNNKVISLPACIGKKMPKYS